MLKSIYHQHVKSIQHCYVITGCPIFEETIGNAEPPKHLFLYFINLYMTHNIHIVKVLFISCTKYELLYNVTLLQYIIKEDEVFLFFSFYFIILLCFYCAFYLQQIIKVLKIKLKNTMPSLERQKQGDTNFVCKNEIRMWAR